MCHVAGAIVVPGVDTEDALEDEKIGMFNDWIYRLGIPPWGGCKYYSICIP